MRYIPLVVLTLVAAPLWAQDAAKEDTDKGYLTTLIEDSLSGSDRQVLITGFSGALSSKASIERLTIADSDGIWLDARGLTLDWNRAAILRGAIDVKELSAQDITVLRAPVSDPARPKPESTPFSLPELPVSVSLGALDIASFTLGAPFLGEDIALSLRGDAELSGGEGDVSLSAERIDGEIGSVVFSGGFNNTTRQLDLDLSLAEAEDGITARLLDIPNKPSVALDLKGSGPLSAFAASLALATNGTERLSGDFSLGTVTGETEGTFDRTFALDINGDVTALFLPEYQDFFGPRVSLKASGTSFADGRNVLDTLALETLTFNLNGSAALGTDGWPDAFDLTGAIASLDGQPVLLPLSGAPTTLRSADLAIMFDAAAGETWTADIAAVDFEQPGLALPDLTLSGGGRIARGDGSTLDRITAALDYAAKGIALDDVGMGDALGSALTGKLIVDYVEGKPVEIDRMTLIGAGIDIGARATIALTETEAGRDVEISTALTLTAQALQRFNMLTGQNLSGGAALQIAGNVGALSGSFDLSAQGLTDDLGLGLPELDALIAGAGRINLRAVRDENGTRLPLLKISTEGAQLDANAKLTSSGSDATVSLGITGLADVRAGLSGPATLTAVAQQTSQGAVSLGAKVTAANDSLTLDLQGPDLAAATLFDSRLEASIADLRAYTGAIGQRLGGGLELSASGPISADFAQLDLNVRATGQSVSAGIAPFDTLLQGTSRLNANIRRADGILRISDASLTAPNLALDGSLTLEGNTSSADFSARVPDIAVLTSDISGPASARGTARQTSDGAWLIDLDAEGPGGTNSSVNGRISSAGRLDIGARGTAALGIANSLIEPRRIQGNADFDLRIVGPAALSSLSGSIRADGARLSAPALGQTLKDISLNVQLGGNQARLTGSGVVEDGGSIAARGSVGFDTGFPAAITIDLSGVSLQDPELYETSVNGSVAVNGPLSGGATIAGALSLGATEIRVPSSSVSALGDLPEVSHVNAPAAVAQTLNRAGLTLAGNDAQTASQGTARPYPLDITINAPSQVFIRGRGLDAELGGRLVLGGTTDNVIPTGQFDLVRGRLNILEQRFDLDEGAASLQGGFVPFIRLVATTEAKTGTTVRIIVEGPADAPEVRFTSTPELPQDEVLAQLIFGRDIASISPLQAVRLAAAVGTLAGTGGGGLINQLRAEAGLDDFDITTDESGNAALRAGKYLSDNVYTDVTVSTDGTTAIDLNLDLSDSFTARGSTASNGESSIGIFFERDY